MKKPTLHASLALAAVVLITSTATDALARWLAPDGGRFISRAPIPIEIEHPYAYANNRPLNSVDPGGTLPQVFRRGTCCNATPDPILVNTSNDDSGWQWLCPGRCTPDGYDCDRMWCNGNYVKPRGGPLSPTTNCNPPNYCDFSEHRDPATDEDHHVRPWGADPPATPGGPYTPHPVAPPAPAPDWVRTACDWYPMIPAVPSTLPQR
jgi:hypothetical protein